MSNEAEVTRGNGEVLTVGDEVVYASKPDLKVTTKYQGQYVTVQGGELQITRIKAFQIQAGCIDADDWVNAVLEDGQVIDIDHLVRTAQWGRPPKAREISLFPGLASAEQFDELAERRDPSYNYNNG